MLTEAEITLGDLRILKPGDVLPIDEPRNVTASAPPPTGNESLREVMAGAMGAAGIVKETPAPPPPVDESVPWTKRGV